MATPASTTAAVLPGNLLFGAGGVKVADLIGAFVKGITAGGLVTFQTSGGVESTVQIAGSGGGGATVSAGTVDPTGGADGDAYIQVDAVPSVVQSLWRNDSGDVDRVHRAGGWDGIRPGTVGCDTGDGAGDGFECGHECRCFALRPSASPGRRRGHAGEALGRLPFHTSKLADGAATAAKMGSGTAASGHVPTADGSGGVTYAAQTGAGGMAGTVTTSAPVSGDGSVGDPVTIENQAIGHVKIGSSVGGQDQAAGRILEADGAGDVRWADKGGGSGGSVATSPGSASTSRLPTPPTSTTSSTT